MRYLFRLQAVYQSLQSGNVLHIYASAVVEVGVGFVDSHIPAVDVALESCEVLHVDDPVAVNDAFEAADCELKLIGVI